MFYFIYTYHIWKKWFSFNLFYSISLSENAAGNLCNPEMMGFLLSCSSDFSDSFGK